MVSPKKCKALEPESLAPLFLYLILYTRLMSMGAPEV